MLIDFSDHLSVNVYALGGCARRGVCGCVWDGPRGVTGRSRRRRVVAATVQNLPVDSTSPPPTYWFLAVAPSPTRRRGVPAAAQAAAPGRARHADQAHRPLAVPQPLRGPAAAAHAGAQVGACCRERVYVYWGSGNTCVCVCAGMCEYACAGDGGSVSRAGLACGRECLSCTELPGVLAAAELRPPPAALHLPPPSTCRPPPAAARHLPPPSPTESGQHGDAAGAVHEARLDADGAAAQRHLRRGVVPGGAHTRRGEDQEGEGGRGREQARRGMGGRERWEGSSAPDMTASAQTPKQYAGGLESGGGR